VTASRSEKSSFDQRVTMSIAHRDAVFLNSRDVGRPGENVVSRAPRCRECLQAVSVSTPVLEDRSEPSASRVLVAVV